MRRVIHLLTLFLCLILTNPATSAYAAEEKVPKKVAADVLLKTGQQIKLTNVAGDLTYRFTWGSFELDLAQYDIQKCELAEAPNKESPALEAKVLLVNGKELKGQLQTAGAVDIGGEWEFGTRKILMRDIKAVTFQRSSGPADALTQPIGTITDQQGNTLDLLTLPETRDRHDLHISHLLQQLFGAADPNYLAQPMGDGYVFLPWAELVQINGSAAQWEVETKAGNKLSFILPPPPTKNEARQRLAAKSSIGAFQIDMAQLKQLRLDTVPALAEKPKSGLAAQPLSPISGTVMDRSGQNYALDGMQFYYAVVHTGIWIPRAPDNYPNVSLSVQVKLVDKTEAAIELARLKAMSFKDGELQGVTSKSGNVLEVQLDYSGSKGTNLEDFGFVGLVRLSPQLKYWGYYSTKSIKSIAFANPD